MRYLALEAATPIASACLTLVGMVYVTAQINWQLALVALAISPLILAVSQAYRRHLRTLAHQLREIESSAFSVVQEVLGALRVVKAFGQEPYEDARFSRRSIEGLQARILYERAEAAFGCIIGLSLAVGTTLVLYIGVRQVQSAAITLVELLLVMTYLFQLYEPLRSISDIIGRLPDHRPTAVRAFGFLDQMPDVPEHPKARRLQRAKGIIAFRDVS